DERSSCATWRQRTPSQKNRPRLIKLQAAKPHAAREIGAANCAGWMGLGIVRGDGSATAPESGYVTTTVAVGSAWIGAVAGAGVDWRSHHAMLVGNASEGGRSNLSNTSDHNP